MGVKDEIIEALRQTDGRLAGLAGRIREKPGAKLPEGEWTVRDALCHLAARSNSVPMVIGLAEQIAKSAAAGEASAFPAGFDIDATNAEQVRERMSRSVDELLTEITEGHRVASDEVRRLDDALIEQRFPNPVGEGDVALADFLRMATAFHDNMHISDIERAVS